MANTTRTTETRIYNILGVELLEIQDGNGNFEYYKKVVNDFIFVFCVPDEPLTIKHIKNLVADGFFDNV